MKALVSHIYYSISVPQKQYFYFFWAKYLFGGKCGQFQGSLKRLKSWINKDYPQFFAKCNILERLPQRIGPFIAF